MWHVTGLRRPGVNCSNCRRRFLFQSAVYPPSECEDGVQSCSSFRLLPGNCCSFTALYLFHYYMHAVLASPVKQYFSSNYLCSHLPLSCYCYVEVVSTAVFSFCRQSPPNVEHVRRVSLRLRNLSPGGEGLPSKPPKEPLFASPEVVC